MKSLAERLKTKAMMIAVVEKISFGSDSELMLEAAKEIERLEAELAAIRAHSPEGPLLDGWQITLSDGHTGYGVYAHMTEYPDEGAIFLLSAGAQPRCPHCDGTGDVHSIDGEWRGECNCGAGAQPVPEGMEKNHD